MSFTLGEVTLPNPKQFTRTFVETSAKNSLIQGKTTKRIENRKERFTLSFEHLTPTQVNSILYEYNLNLVRTFSVDEYPLIINETNVLINISPRDYPTSGVDYKENLSIILTEVI